MTNILCILASPRKNGYSARLLNPAIDAIKSFDSVNCELIHLYEYDIRPCASCWSCLRDEDHRCVLNDSMGGSGEGELFNKIVDANGVLISQPVYYGRPPAITHLFFERLYPFKWSGELSGMPFASISQAANNGGARTANTEMARWASIFGLKYVGGLPVHLVQYDRALSRAKYLGRKIAEAAKTDSENRVRLMEIDRYLGSTGNPWSSLESTISDITNRTFNYEDSLIAYALNHNTIKKPESRDLLKEASEELKLTLYYYRLKNFQKAAEHLVKMRSFWGPATFKEFLEDEVWNKK